MAKSSTSFNKGDNWKGNSKGRPTGSVSSVVYAGRKPKTQQRIAHEKIILDNMGPAIEIFSKLLFHTTIDELTVMLKESSGKRTVMEAIAIEFVRSALLNKDTRAMKFIFEKVFGFPSNFIRKEYARDVLMEKWKGMHGVDLKVLEK